MDVDVLEEFANRQLYVRGFFHDVKNTTRSFKSWDKCMDDKPCKIIAIVGIVLAAIFGMYLVGGLLYFLRSGVTNISEFICWCCFCKNRSGGAAPGNDGYRGQPPAPPMVVYQPIRDPDPGYGGYDGYRGGPDVRRGRGNKGYYDERLSRSSDLDVAESYDLEAQKDPFNKKGNYRQSEDTIPMQSYHPNLASPNQYQEPSPSHSPVRGNTGSTYFQPSTNYYVPKSNSHGADNGNVFYENTAYQPDRTMSTATANANPPPTGGYQNFTSRAPFPQDDDRDTPGFNRYGGY